MAPAYKPKLAQITPGPNLPLIPGINVRQPFVKLSQHCGKTNLSLYLKTIDFGRGPKPVEASRCISPNQYRIELKRGFEQIINSIDRRLFAPLAPETLVLPGHGEGTTIGTEQPSLDAWIERGW